MIAIIVVLGIVSLLIADQDQSAAPPPLIRITLTVGVIAAVLHLWLFTNLPKGKKTARTVQIFFSIYGIVVGVINAPKKLLQLVANALLLYLMFRTDTKEFFGCVKKPSSPSGDTHEEMFKNFVKAAKKEQRVNK